MSSEDPTSMAMNASNLYLEESFTDREIGTIRRLTPIDGEGQPDPSREVEYIGQAQMMTPMGALPLNFALLGPTLAEAAEQFGAGAQVALELASKELEELQRQQASSIVVPGGGAGGAGGMSGGGIQLR